LIVFGAVSNPVFGAAKAGDMVIDVLFWLEDDASVLEVEIAAD
jgi:hypothetical protein